MQKSDSDREFWRKINIHVSFNWGFASIIFVNGQGNLDTGIRDHIVDDVLKDWGSSKLQ